MKKIRKQMNFSNEDFEAIVNAWTSVIASIEDPDLRGKIEKFTEDFAPRLFACPASPSVDYAAAHNCMPTGLVEHSLRVFRIFKESVDKNMKLFEHPVNNDDIVIAALFHDMGKLGDPWHSYYENQDSDWHAELGMFYKLNSDIEYMRVPHRSLFLLQHYGVKLPLHVYKTILLHDGPHDETNKPYSMKEGLFAVLLSQADIMAALIEQRRYAKWENNGK